MTTQGIVLHSLVETCFACPSQWDGWDANGTYYYIRYRWGLLVVVKDDVLMGTLLFEEQIGDSMDGSISVEDMLKASGMSLATDNVGEDFA